ncbi:protoporphyrinogen/coproporphyrinogen oxidase [Nocardia jiangsuensis]|uniref:Protoporphyrinogen/coproporphyrinogen oxidase n=1 Tax=Nocardia jiangsuensis TaxID=1691563 RepID=A0ABV8DP48_9NOCA
MTDPAGAGGRTVAVVGGGISGMAAAFALYRAGWQVDLLERENVLGGRFGIDSLRGRPMLTGARHIGLQFTEFRQFVTALADVRFEPSPLNMTKVVDGRLATVAAEDSRGVLRYLAEFGSAQDVAKLTYLVHRIATEENRFLGSNFFAKLGAAGDDRPLSEHFGSGLADALLRPIVTWVHGAELDEMYLGTLGATLGAALDSFEQIVGGVEPVLTALSKLVTVKKNARVESVAIRRGRVRGLSVAEDGGPAREHPYDAVVLATPAAVTADLVAVTVPALSALLATVRYFPASVTTVEYDRDVFPPGVSTLSMNEGPYSTAALYRAPERNIVRYVIAGRAARPLPPEDRSAAALDAAEKRVQATFGSVEPVRLAVVERRWERAFSGLRAFHGEFLARLRKETGNIGGLALAGDYLRGVSLEACYRSGVEAAHRLTA